MFASNSHNILNDNELDPFSRLYTSQFHLDLENLESLIMKNHETGEISGQEPSVLPAAAAAKKRSSAKDRHSKIQTARGPRDRRMRLSLDVAREFFGLQDMLGFDKASKTVEWLMNQARSEIKNVKRIHKKSDDLSNAVVSGPSKSNYQHPKGQKGKDKNVKRSRKFNRLIKKVVTKDLRVKARERAKERTKEKLRRRVLGVSEEARNTYLSSSFETSEVSGTQSTANIGMMSQQEDAIEKSLENFNGWSLDSILNHYHTDPYSSLQNQDEDVLSFLGKPWEYCNHQDLFQLGGYNYDHDLCSHCLY